MENMEIWDKVKTPPKEALKPIQSGRLKGKTDISPQWRMMALTEQFGPVGFGWTYKVTKQWTEAGGKDEVGAFVNIELFIKHNGEWSEPIPGGGGSMLVASEKNGLHFSDEGFKMATTDAISVAAKALGVGSDVYSGALDSKYQVPSAPAAQSQQPAQTPDHERVKQSLHTLYGSDKKTALDTVEKMTGFKGKEGWVDGVRDYTKLKGKRLEILAEKLEKKVADKRAQPPKHEQSSHGDDEQSEGERQAMSTYGI